MRMRWLTLAAVAAVVVVIASLGAVVRGESATAAGFSACLVTDGALYDGRYDKSLSRLAELGLQRAERAGIEGHVIRSHSPADFIPNLKACVSSGAAITIAVGPLMVGPLCFMTAEYPKSNFAVVDVDYRGITGSYGLAGPRCPHPRNIEGLTFREEQAGYIVGYAAGLWAKSENATNVGTVTPLRSPVTDRYVAGFEFGAKKADPGVMTIRGYPSISGGVTRNHCVAKALEQIGQNSVVEFQVAAPPQLMGSACGLGILDAARQQNVFGIGVDTDQGYLGPWVMTSAVKRADVAVFRAVIAASHAKFHGRTNFVSGASVDGVGYGQWSPRIPASIRNAVAAQYRQLKAGKVVGIPTKLP